MMKNYYYILVICVGALLLAAPVSADTINMNYVSVATGVDNGPQDGIFDAFTLPNLGSVNNNGFTSFRTAVEFNLSAIPAGSSINSAKLTMVASNFEGMRTIAINGYAGNGAVQLADFAANNLIGTASVSPGTQTSVFDATSFVADLIANGKSHAGFNVREDPANTLNFVVMSLVLQGVPVLSIDYSQIVDIDIKPGSVPNSINTYSYGKISVAILSNLTFDAPSEVDMNSLTFGRTGDEESLAFCNDTPEDVNGVSIQVANAPLRAKAKTSAGVW